MAIYGEGFVEEVAVDDRGVVMTTEDEGRLIRLRFKLRPQLLKNRGGATELTQQKIRLGSSGPPHQTCPMCQKGRAWAQGIAETTPGHFRVKAAWEPSRCSLPHLNAIRDWVVFETQL